MILAILNSKGGVGKTTTAVNLAAQLAQRGERVRLVDLDPQGSATLHLGREPDGEALAAALRSKAALVGEVVEGVELVAGGPAVGAWAGKVAGQLLAAGALKRCLAVSEPALTILDTPPTIGTLVTSAILAATYALVPVQTEAAPLLGLTQTLDVLAEAEDMGSPVRLIGIVPTLYDGRRRLDADVLIQLVERFGELVADPIRRTVTLAEALGAGVPVHIHAPGSPGAEDYGRLAGWLLKQEVR